ncbi:MAG: beta-lactamase family protein [Chloroflexota bacterium]|nr:beta-lactamase family protein [Chloroflexota bacterium]
MHAPLDTARIRTTANELIERLHIPGIAIGVVQGDDLVFSEGFGYADIETKKAFEPAMRHRIGSVTKTMTALCAMALVDEGRLSLEDRVIDRLPDVKFIGAAETMNIRHILTHTSGIGVVPRAAQLKDIGNLLESDTADTPWPLDAYVDGITVEVPPGARWCYANHAFALLGEIVARVEGAPIEEVLRRRVFAPLGMTDTDDLDLPHPELTTPYHPASMRALMQAAGMEVPEEQTIDGHNIRGQFHHLNGRAGRAAGAVQSNIGDMARYASALLGHGAGIVRPETFDAMVAPQWCPDARMVNVGLAFGLGRIFGRAVYTLGGGVPGGWSAQLTVYPEEGLSVLVHINAMGAESPAALIEQSVLGAEDDPLPAGPVDERTLADATGKYQAPDGLLTNFRIITGIGRVTIAPRNGDLVMTSERGPIEQGLRLLPGDPGDRDLLTLDDGSPLHAHVALIRDAAGAVTGLRLGMMELRKV